MELKDIRAEIDTTDDALVKLFLRRMELAAQAGEFKAETGMPLRDESREQEILTRVCASAGELSGSVETLFCTLFELSRTYQKEREAVGVAIGKTGTMGKTK